MIRDHGHTMSEPMATCKRCNPGTMRLSRTHAEFWSQHKAPQWARRVLNKKIGSQKSSFYTPAPYLLLDHCINEHGGPVKENEHYREASNYIGILKRTREVGGTANLLDHMSHTAFDPYPSDSKRRQGFARKWAKRILGDLLGGDRHMTDEQMIWWINQMKQPKHPGFTVTDVGGRYVAVSPITDSIADNIARSAPDIGACERIDDKTNG